MQQSLRDVVNPVGAGLVVNHRCSLNREDGLVVVWVDGQVWLTFDEGDLAAGRLAMTQLCTHQVATHAQVAAAFGVGTATVERHCRAYREGGVQALVPRRGRGRAPRLQGAAIDKAVLAARKSGQSVQSIADKFGVSRTAVKTSLTRSGFGIESKQVQLPVADRPQHAPGVAVEQPSGAVAQAAAEPSPQPQAALTMPAEFTADAHPADRSLDRLLARQGLLQDAAPLFEGADGVRDLGAMLALAVLVQQGVFVQAKQVFHGIGPAFYGLRTVVVCLSLLMVLNLGRLQDVMQREPGDMGRLLGLDRSPELKTLRRKLGVLAAQGKSLDFMDALAARQLASEEHIWAYVDGHVSVYSGKHKLREHHVASLRAARPSVIDYWVNHTDGTPLLVITGAAREGLVSQLSTVRHSLGRLAPDKPVTIVFDREGWSPKLFAQLAADPRVRFLTYRKAPKGRSLPRVPLSRFQTVDYEANGRPVSYELADGRVHIPYEVRKGERKNLVLRQITRRKHDGRQVHIVTNDFERPAAELAWKMTHRWSQENFFKYDREHRDLDALVTHGTQPAADPERPVANPARLALDASIRAVRGKIEDALRELGARQLRPGADCESLRAYVEALNTDLDGLLAKREATAARVPFNSTERGRDAVQPRVETRRLMHCFRMLGSRAELALLELLRPHFKDWQHEGRALVRAIVHSSGSLRVANGNLQIQLQPQASPYKTRALEQLCASLTAMQCAFPGTDLLMSFSVLPRRAPS